MRCALVIACFVMASAAFAQRTWIVDARGGTGVDFLDLPPAVVAASAGDTILLIRTLNSPYVVYHGTVIDKSLKIVGVTEAGVPLDPGPAFIFDKVEVRNIPAGSQVLLANLNLGGRFLPGPPPVFIPNGLVMQNCAGKVHAESVAYGPYPGGGAGEIRIEDCADVSLHWCNLDQPGPSMLFRRSNVAISECIFRPFYPSAGCPYEPPCIDHTESTVRVENSTVRFSDSIVTGASECQSAFHGLQLARAAVNLVSGFVLMGPATQLYGGYVNGAPGNAVLSYGTVVIDPRSGSTGIVGTGIQQNQPLDSVFMERVIRNQPFGIVVAGPPNGYALLAIGLPMPQTVALPFGNLLLDPNAMGVLGLLALDQYGNVRQYYPAPASAPMDMLFAFQAATMNPGGVLGLTFPSVFSIHWEGGHTWP